MLRHTTTMPPKRPYHHGNLRQSLLDAAVPLLAQKGVAGLSLREVAKQAGVSHAAPYRHFADKRALLEALAQTGYEHIERTCRAAMATHPGDPVQQWRTAGTGYLAYVATQPEVTHLMYSGALPLPQAGDALREAAQHAYAALAAIMNNGVQAGLFRPLDVDTLTLTSLATVHGLSQLYASGLLGPDVDPALLESLGLQAGDALLNGLLREPPARG